MNDVLVIGAGPVGLFLSCELARHGVAVRLIEARTEIVQKSKAVMIQARTLEVLENHGIIDAFLAVGRRLTGLGLYSAGERFSYISMEELDTPYPFILCLQQYKTEALLEERLQDLGGQVDRGVRMTAISQSAECVSVTLEHNGEEEHHQARWVVCCDGAHSPTRKVLGIPFTGEDIDVQFTLADVDIEWDRPDDEVLSFFSPRGVLGFIALPEPNRWRLFASLPVEERDALPEPHLGFYQQLIKERLGSEVSISNPVWMSHFGIRQRKVAQYRTGRVFLAGDAAHCHSPAGGQGMNTGLQDAANLAWKLALVARRVGRSELLDSYHDEREPIATALLKATAQQTRINAMSSPIAQEIRNQVIGFLSRFEVIQHRISHSMGQLDLHYRDSPIVHEDRSSVFEAVLGTPLDESASLRDWQDFGAAPRPGDRALDAVFGDEDDEQRLFQVMAGTQHTLLLFDGRPTEAGYENLAQIATTLQARYPKLLRVHIVVPFREKPETLPWDGSTLLDGDGVLHHRYGAGSECLYLIRPDGYVGYRCQPADGERLQAYLARLFWS
jgi:2-polyprenyl-6-methoxyphenol hydroxylase-like FAD-dependent oxidoreductase